MLLELQQLLGESITQQVLAQQGLRQLQAAVGRLVGDARAQLGLPAKAAAAGAPHSHLAPAGGPGFSGVGVGAAAAAGEEGLAADVSPSATAASTAALGQPAAPAAAAAAADAGWKPGTGIGRRKPPGRCRVYSEEEQQVMRELGVASLMNVQRHGQAGGAGSQWKVVLSGHGLLRKLYGERWVHSAHNRILAIAYLPVVHAIMCTAQASASLATAYSPSHAIMPYVCGGCRQHSAVLWRLQQGLGPSMCCTPVLSAAAWGPPVTVTLLPCAAPSLSKSNHSPAFRD